MPFEADPVYYSQYDQPELIVTLLESFFGT
jgi:hypothetical protein